MTAPKLRECRHRHYWRPKEPAALYSDDLEFTLDRWCVDCGSVRALAHDGSFIWHKPTNTRPTPSATVDDVLERLRKQADANDRGAGGIAMTCQHVRAISIVGDGAQLSTVGYPSVSKWCADCGALLCKDQGLWAWRTPKPYTPKFATESLLRPASRPPAQLARAKIIHGARIMRGLKEPKTK